MVAARVAAQFIIPARLLMVTATRAAGLRFVVAGLNVALVVLAAVVIFEKVFGLQKRLQRTLVAKETVLEQLDDTRNRQSMLELVLQKTRNNLMSLSSVDDDTDEDARGRASSSCPLCGHREDRVRGQDASRRSVSAMCPAGPEVVG